MRILIVVLVVIGVAAGDEAEMDKRQMEMLVRTCESKESVKIHLLLKYFFSRPKFPCPET